MIKRLLFIGIYAIALLNSCKEVLEDEPPHAIIGSWQMTSLEFVADYEMGVPNDPGSITYQVHHDGIGSNFTYLINFDADNSYTASGDFTLDENVYQFGMHNQYSSQINAIPQGTWTLLDNDKNIFFENLHNHESTIEILYLSQDSLVLNYIDIATQFDQNALLPQHILLPTLAPIWHDYSGSITFVKL